ncbi:MAG: sugar phosphate isomerase/epimerase [Cellulophaga sp.]
MKYKNKVSLLVLFLILFMGSELKAQEVGFQLYSLRDQFKEDVDATLKTISSWGITKIEGGSTYGLSKEEFLDKLKKNNLTMVSYDVSFEDLRDSPEEVIKRAKFFGASFIMCAWIPHSGNKFTLKNVKKAVAVFNKAGEMIKSEGLNLVYHPHGYEFRPYKQGTLFDYMVSNADFFDFELDVFWVKQAGENPLELLRKYPNKFKLLHLKDRKHGTVSNNTGSADQEANVVLGTGDVGIKSLVAEAKKNGIKYLFIEDESSNVLSQVPKSLKYLKTLE